MHAPQGTPEGNKAKALGAAGAVVPHDACVGAVADALEGLQQHGVCHVAAQVADKDVEAHLLAQG